MKQVSGNHRNRGAALAGLLCLLVLAGVCSWRAGRRSGPTLPGADQINPTVLVGGVRYEWHRGAAVSPALPEGCVYYGALTHVTETAPARDGEFAAAFSAAGEIYTVPGDPDTVYVVLTTGWMENAAVRFDRCE